MGRPTPLLECDIGYEEMKEPECGCLVLVLQSGTAVILCDAHQKFMEECWL